jgi:hypothetical protein
MPRAPLTDFEHIFDGKVKGLVAVKKEAARKGFKKGRGGHGKMPCPMPGCKGEVSFAISGSNGHSRVVCNAPNCLNYVE